MSSRRVTRDQQEEMGLIRVQRDNVNLVLPEQGPQKATKVTELDSFPSIDIPKQNAAVTVQQKTSKTDATRAFIWKTFSMSVVLGVLLTIGAIVAGVNAGWTVGISIIGFLSVWIVAYILDLRQSPEAIQRENNKKMWKEISKINDARIKAYLKERGIE